MKELSDYAGIVLMGAFALFSMGVLIAAFATPIVFVAWLFFG